LQSGHVRGRTEGGVDLHGAGERIPCRAAVAGVDKVHSGRLQRLGRQQGPTGVVVALGGREQPGSIMIEQAAAIERVRLPVRDLRFGSECGGLACEGLSGA
jgi:hypothetical protein